ncbi:MAG TPA: hypothetical protein VFU21_06760 [Kofleriaceae bacterium]|nr:hypothetical protein [Kofleriaceae bacterium]
MMNLVALSAALLAIACNDDGLVGQRCVIGTDAGNSDQVIVASPALDCPTRTCLHAPGGDDLCTADCTSDRDCEAVAGSPCASGFTCAVPVVVGPFACRRMCMCRDGLDIPPDGLPPPEACR